MILGKGSDSRVNVESRRDKIFYVQNKNKNWALFAIDAIYDMLHLSNNVLQYRVQYILAPLFILSFSTKFRISNCLLSFITKVEVLNYKYKFDINK